MPEYMMRVERQNSEKTMEEHPNLTAPICPNLVPFTWPEPLEYLSESQVRNIIQFQLQHINLEDLEYQKDQLNQKETISITNYRNNEGEIYNGGFEIPEYLQTLTAVNEAENSGN